MRTMVNRTLRLAVLASLTLASGCANRAPTLQRFPDASLVQRETEPKLTQAHVDAGDKGLNDYMATFRAWALRGWDRVDAQCRWFVEQGATFRCPPAPEVPPPDPGRTP